MKDLQNKVAVVIGAGSGIGRALAMHCAREKMKVVLADVEEGPLEETRKELEALGVPILALKTDVSEKTEVEALAKKALEDFGKVHLLCNTAGVAAGASIWESTENDLKWVVGVNVWGTIHALRAFIPIMIDQDEDCHIVNTSSIAGLSSFHPSAPYQLTKHGIVALSEQLHHDLVMRGAKVKVSVLCPGFVDTNIMDAERNRPEIYKNESDEQTLSPEEQEAQKAFRMMIKQGMPPETVAEHVFQAIREEKFYVLTHPEMMPLIQARTEDILKQRNPTLPPMG